MKDTILVIVISILVLAILIIGVVSISYITENRSDEENKTELLSHKIKCDGNVDLISTYKGYCHTPTYVYECNKCKQIFEFHDTSVFQTTIK